MKDERESTVTQMHAVAFRVRRGGSVHQGWTNRAKSRINETVKSDTFPFSIFFVGERCCLPRS